MTTHTIKDFVVVCDETNNPPASIDQCKLQFDITAVRSSRWNISKRRQKKAIQKFLAFFAYESNDSYTRNQIQVGISHILHQFSSKTGKYYR